MSIQAIQADGKQDEKIIYPAVRAIEEWRIIAEREREERANRKASVAERFICESHGAIMADNTKPEWTEEGHHAADTCNYCRRNGRRSVVSENPEYRAQFPADDFSDLLEDF